MTDKQRKNLEKMFTSAMQDLPMDSASAERKMIENIKEVTHVTRMLYEAYLDEGFSNEQAMFLTTSVLTAGGRE